MFNQRTFDIIAGFAVFVAVMLLLNDVYHPLAMAIIAGLFIYVLLNNTTKVQGLINQFTSDLNSMHQSNSTASTSGVSVSVPHG